MTSLTDAQQNFVDELVSTGCTPTEAARRAGFAAPGQEAYRLMRKDHVVMAIREQRERVVSGHAANVAIATLVEIMTDKAAPASARVSAARTVCDAAGDFKQTGKIAEPANMANLTQAQLARIVSKLDDELDQLAGGNVH